MTKYCRRCAEELSIETCHGHNGRIHNLCLREEKTEQIRAKRRANGMVPRQVRKIDEDGQECATCELYKSWEDYYDDKNNPKTGKRATCVECVLLKQTERLLKKNFNITLEQYNLLLTDQNNVCAICEEVEQRISFKAIKPDRLSVDHFHDCQEDHKSEQGCLKCIRGLLCASCNSMIAFVENRSKTAAMFKEYLQRRPLTDIPNRD